MTTVMQLFLLWMGLGKQVNWSWVGLVACCPMDPSLAVATVLSKLKFCVVYWLLNGYLYYVAYIYSDHLNVVLQIGRRSI